MRIIEYVYDLLGKLFILNSYSINLKYLLGHVRAN